MSTKGQPEPGPENPISRRLEQVRKSRGMDLKAFWQRMVDEAGLSLSYASARTYHFDRVPPVEYLVAVADVYEEPLNWLATGAGDLTQHVRTEMEAREMRLHLPFTPREGLEDAVRQQDRVKEAFAKGFFGDVGRSLSAEVYRLLKKCWAPALFWLPAKERSNLALPRRIGSAAAAPLRAHGIDPSSMSSAEVTAYLEAIRPAFINVEQLEVDRDFSDVLDEGD